MLLFSIHCKGLELLLLLLMLLVAQLVIREQLVMQCAPLCTPGREIRTAEDETYVI